MGQSTKYESRAGLWLAGATALAGIVAFELDLIRLRGLLGLACGAFVAAAAYASRSRPDWRQIRTACICVGLTLLVQVLPEILRTGDHHYYITGTGLAFVLLGWACVFALFAERNPSPNPFAVARPQAVAAAVAVATLVMLAVVHWEMRRGNASVVDEVLYLFQSENLRRGQVALPIDGSLSPFFSIRQAFFRGNSLNGQYTPGWPAIIALFGSIGLRWWAGVVAAAASVWFTYLLGARAHSRIAGILASALLATSYWFVFLSASYHASAASLALCTGGALLLVSSETSRRPLLLHACAGLVFGCALTVRPLTAVAMGLSAYAWTALRVRPKLGAWLRSSAAVAAGTVLPIAAMFAYNAATTGKARTFGYSVAQSNLHSMGFGTRGLVYFEKGGEAVQTSSQFGMYEAVAQFFAQFRDVANDFLPACMWAGVLLLALVRGVRVDFRYVLAFAVLPLAHFFFPYVNPRFYAELMPFLAIGTAVLLVELSRTDGRAARAMLVLLLAGNLWFSRRVILVDRAAFHNQFAPSFAAITDLARERGNVLVFVNDDPKVEVVYEALWWFNVNGIPGRIVVARDLGPRNVELMAKLPTHYPVRIEGHGNWTPNLTPLKQ